MISSRSRYDHFDTSPYLSQHQHLRKRGELMGRTKKNIQLKIPEKPRKIKGFRSGSYRIATTISSQPRYDHFDTSPNIMALNIMPQFFRFCKRPFPGSLLPWALMEKPSAITPAVFYCGRFSGMVFRMTYENGTQSAGPCGF